MQAGRFLSLVKNVTDLRPDELVAARELADRYPYSQLLHLLVARGSRDQKTADEQPVLNRAAVYATDRAVLKAVMTRNAQPRVEAFEQDSPDAPPAAPPAKEPVDVKPKAKPEPSVVAGKPVVQEQKARLSPSTLEGDALRDDLKAELDRLHQLKSAFEASYEQLKKSDATKSEPPTVKEDDAVPTPKLHRKTPQKSPTSAETPDAPLIEEIKTSKRKPKLVSPKVAEQGEIIDQFIKVAPTLPRTKPTEPSTDLSEESVNYGDNIVSETLVEILLKQGKKAKAIEMLKKLIWKFPQKKAYFAAQIEALKG